MMDRLRDCLEDAFTRIEVAFELNAQRLEYPSPEARQGVLDRDGHRCVVCRSTRNLTIDHLHPKSRGGHNGTFNLQTLCASCNSSKWTYEFWSWLGYRDEAMKRAAEPVPMCRGCMSVLRLDPYELPAQYLCPNCGYMPREAISVMREGAESKAAAQRRDR